MKLRQNYLHLLLCLEHLSDWATGLDLVRLNHRHTRWWQRRRQRRGTVYIVLDRLLSKGLVQRRGYRDPVMGITRLQWRLSASGRAYLQGALRRGEMAGWFC